MIQMRRGARLGEEAIALVGGRSALLGADQFERDDTLQALVVGAVHDAHAAAAQAGVDPVLTECFTDHRSPAYGIASSGVGRVVGPFATDNTGARTGSVLSVLSVARRETDPPPSLALTLARPTSLAPA